MDNRQKYKSGGGTCCSVINCTYNYKKLRDVLDRPCFDHPWKPRRRCGCEPPFRFFSPKTPDDRREWLTQLRLKKPPKYLSVCSFHFVEKKPTSQNPLPQNFLGYDKPVVKSRRIFVRSCPTSSVTLAASEHLNKEKRLNVKHTSQNRRRFFERRDAAENVSGPSKVPSAKQFLIPGSLPTEIMRTRSVVSPKPSPRKDLKKADLLLFCSDLHPQSEQSMSSKKPACNKVTSTKKRKRQAADSEKVSAAESLLVLSSSSNVVDRWVKEENQDANSSAKSKYAEETLADMTVEDGVGPNLPTLKEEPIDLEYQLSSQEPLSSVEPFNEIKPVFLTEVASEAESHHTYRQQYEIKHDPEEFKIELNPDWHQDDQDSERDNPLPNMETELHSEDIKPIRKDYTVKTENASGGSVSHTAQRSVKVQKLLHDESRQKICTKMFIKAHGLEKVGKTAGTAAITSVSNGQLHKNQKVIVVSAAGKVEHCLTITQPSVLALNPQTIVLVTPNGGQQSSVRQPLKKVSGRRIILLTSTGEKKSTSKDFGISHDLKVPMSHPDTETTTFSKEKCGGQKIQPSAENQQGIAEMPEQFSAGSSPLICKNCNARIEGQPTLVRHLMTCSSTNGRLWPKSPASTNSASQVSSSTTCSLYQKPLAPKLTEVWVLSKDPALLKTDVPNSFKVSTSTRDRSNPSKEINVEDEPYRCEVCDSLFKELQDFRTHNQIHRKHEINLCPRCGKQFSSPSAFDKHMRKHGSERPFACNQCPKTFKYMTCLKSHLHLHTGEKRFQCEMCFKKFSSSTHLKRHRLTHTRDGPLKCPECPASFMAPSVYKIHVRVHTGERPYPCKFCDKAFRDTSALNLHLRIHMRDKPYKCHVCGASFQRPGGLKQHVMTHAGMSPYECNQCGIAFGSSGALKRHTQYHS